MKPLDQASKRHLRFLILGIEVGVSSISIELADIDQLFANIYFKGSFVGVCLNFLSSYGQKRFPEIAR